MVCTEQEAITFCHLSLLKKQEFQGAPWQLKIFFGEKGISVAVYELINLMKKRKEESVSRENKIDGTSASPVVQTAMEARCLFQYSF